jgi:hypothetical protein
VWLATGHENARSALSAEAWVPPSIRQGGSSGYRTPARPGARLSTGCYFQGTRSCRCAAAKNNENRTAGVPVANVSKMPALRLAISADSDD